MDEKIKQAHKIAIKMTETGNIHEGMQDVMEIISENGTRSVVENPFGPMKATYMALREDPNAIPDLNDESRERIINELNQMDVAVPVEKFAEPEQEHKREPLVIVPNRHDRRAAAAKARKVAKKAR